MAVKQLRNRKTGEVDLLDSVIAAAEIAARTTARPGPDPDFSHWKDQPGEWEDLGAVGGGSALAHLAEDEGQFSTVISGPGPEVWQVVVPSDPDDIYGPATTSTYFSSVGDFFSITPDDGSVNPFGARRVSDTENRYELHSDGSEHWGPGDGPTDLSSGRTDSANFLFAGGWLVNDTGVWASGDGDAFAGPYAGLTPDGQLDLKSANGGAILVPHLDGIFKITNSSGGPQGCGLFLVSPDNTKVRVLRLSNADALELV